MENNESLKKDVTNPNVVYGEYLFDVLEEYGVNVIEQHGDLTITVKPQNLVRVVTFLKNHVNCQYKILTDLTAVDYIQKELRFEVVYMFLSVRFSHRIRVKTHVSALETVPSITGVHSSAGWYEREVFDLFGIVFENHPDLRRILTDYGFEGHPMRKDFPLTGYNEVRYDQEKKRVVCEPLELSQEFRSFDYNTVWNNGTKEQVLVKSSNVLFS